MSNGGGGSLTEAIIDMMWHIPTVMATLLAAGLLMGQRHVGELSVFDLLTGIAIGAVGGAGIVAQDAPHLGILLAIMGLALLHFLVTWGTTKWAWFGRKITFEPLIVVRKGQPVKAAMGKVRMAMGDLLPLLRERDIFDLREVEYAILEPDGKVTVIRTEDPQAKKGLPRAVIVDGKIDRQVLEDTGWDERRLREGLLGLGHSDPAVVFLATIDDANELVAFPRDLADEGPAIHH
jgi:uncharacterized membrane protein YcaP (DUF421 family)